MTDELVTVTVNTPRPSCLLRCVQNRQTKLARCYGCRRVSGPPRLTTFCNPHSKRHCLIQRVVLMHPLVRNLYKRILVVSKDYPAGPELVKRKAKEYFRANAALTDEVEIKRAVSAGRWYVRNELHGVIQLKKYREMAKRYN